MAIPGEFTTLRVRWKGTIDGINLAMGENGLPIWQEMELPVTARKHLEAANEKLPFHLRKEITEMNYQKAPAPQSVVKGVGVAELAKTAPSTEELLEVKKEDSPEIAALKAEIAELKALRAEIAEQRELIKADKDVEIDEDDTDNDLLSPVKRKAGRPAKIKEETV